MNAHAAKAAHILQECPYRPGTPAAKLWWTQNVEAPSKASITPAMRAQYGDRVVGAYHGKPLVPGEAGHGQGDFEFLVDKLIIYQGLSPGMAKSIALKYHISHYVNPK